jgi:hypothetical protein
MPADQQARRPNQRLGQTYRFSDPDMDLFFVAALGWGPAGGLDVGQVFHIASKIRDGDGGSWVDAFAPYGDAQNAQADEWKRRGWTRAAGEAKLKAFASYRSVWQFAPLGEIFRSLYAKHKAAFAAAMQELALSATFFDTPYEGKALPGVFLQNANADAPVVLVIGGADTCLEDLFLTVGANIFERGYSVAIVDSRPGRIAGSGPALGSRSGKAHLCGRRCPRKSLRRAAAPPCAFRPKPGWIFRDPCGGFRAQVCRRRRQHAVSESRRNVRRDGARRSGRQYGAAGEQRRRAQPENPDVESRRR